ncbi:hypothetical protein K1W69_08160 [Hoeflea sp. WL0058]|uniref:Uncharacterized protein n=1 Tax=Flavimaribacter sediminis TaxID=2865987 RepID=A0AAE2ZPF3_9HYPH|nr:hypothetical protein [Flavimaribacter sediminis]MBW8637157.1 hypothetical protein [Flavimaribacter sediminis]
MRVTVTGEFIRLHGRMAAAEPHQTRHTVNMNIESVATIDGQEHCEDDASGAHHDNAQTDVAAFRGVVARDCGVEENTVLC